MRILLLSDLHFGKASVGGFPHDQITRAKKHGSYDVLIFCGDLAESIPHFNEGLDAMRSIDAAHRLFVAGNNDIERLEYLCRSCHRSRHVEPLAAKGEDLSALTIRDYDYIVDAVCARAKKQGTTMSKLIRQFLRDYIAESNTRDTPKDANT